MKKIYSRWEKHKDLIMGARSYEAKAEKSKEPAEIAYFKRQAFGLRSEAKRHLRAMIFCDDSFTKVK